MKHKVFLAGMLASLLALVVLAGCASAPVDLAGRQAYLQKEGIIYPTTGDNNAVAVSLTIWAASGTEADSAPNYVEFVDDSNGKFHARWGDEGTPFTYTASKDDKPDGERFTVYITGEITANGTAEPYTIEFNTREWPPRGSSKFSYLDTTYIVSSSKMLTDPENFYSAPRGEERAAMEAALAPKKDAFIAQYGTEGLSPELKGTIWSFDGGTLDFSGTRLEGFIRLRLSGQSNPSLLSMYVYNKGNVISFLDHSKAVNRAENFAYERYDPVSGSKVGVLKLDGSFQYSINDDGKTLTISDAQGSAAGLARKYTFQNKFIRE
ncbi:hypothetical protein ACYULU_15420 [Breznakiellaceae bacterium SP9]